MSLFKQLLIAICLFLVVAFSGSFMVSLESSRTQYVNQLRSHAQDAATALALSLTPNIDDPAMVELLVSSIFDSGYYSSIRVVNQVTEEVMVERSGTPEVSNVPDWFVKLIGLEPAGGDALVSRGWQQAARVEVVSHPMFAVAKLWQSALGSLGWLLLCGAVSAVLGPCCCGANSSHWITWCSNPTPLPAASSSACPSCRVRRNCAAWCRR